MATSKINLCVDSETKKQAEAILSELGLNMTTAINVYLKKVVAEGGIPFELTVKNPNAETVDAIKEGKRIAYDKNEIGFDSIESLKASFKL